MKIAAFDYLIPVEEKLKYDREWEYDSLDKDDFIEILKYYEENFLNIFYLFII